MAKVETPTMDEQKPQTNFFAAIEIEEDDRDEFDRDAEPIIYENQGYKD